MKGNHRTEKFELNWINEMRVWEEIELWIILYYIYIIKSEDDDIVVIVFLS
jgi:hypothetical protein